MRVTVYLTVTVPPPKLVTVNTNPAKLKVIPIDPVLEISRPVFKSVATMAKADQSDAALEYRAADTRYIAVSLMVGNVYRVAGVPNVTLTESVAVLRILPVTMPLLVSPLQNNGPAGVRVMEGFVELLPAELMLVKLCVENGIDPPANKLLFKETFLFDVEAKLTTSVVGEVNKLKRQPSMLSRVTSTPLNRSTLITAGLVFASNQQLLSSGNEMPSRPSAAMVLLFCSIMVFSITSLKPYLK